MIRARSTLVVVTIVTLSASGALPAAAATTPASVKVVASTPLPIDAGKEETLRSEQANMLGAALPACSGNNASFDPVSLWLWTTVGTTNQAEQTGAISLPSGTAPTDVSYQECERDTHGEDFAGPSASFSEVTYFDSIVAYLGTQPFNADLIGGDDTLTYNYFTIDVGISIPPSFNLNPDYRDPQNNSQSVSNNWQLWKHNVRIESDGPSGARAYTGHNHTLVGSFTFGGDNYNTVLNRDWPN